MTHRTGLLIIDMQPCYFEEPALAAQLSSLVAHVNELTRAARSARQPIVTVRTEHARDRSTWTLNMLEDDQGFAFHGTAEVRNVDGLDVEGAIDVVKTRDSAFHETRLRAVLREHDVTRVVLCGVSTHSCIAQTAMAGFAENLEVVVAREAIASEDADLSSAMLDFLSAEMRQQILDQTGAVAVLAETPGGQR